jgi:anthranilate synthase component 1
MEIISELEQMPREAYTGSVGYVSQNGKMDFNILIRSFIHQEKTLTFRAGAGIVFDSNPMNELAETRHKAEGLIKVFKE